MSSLVSSLTKFQQNICNISFHWYAAKLICSGGSGTPTATKIEIFVWKINDFLSLTVVTKNFVPDATVTGVQDPRERL